MEPGVGSTVTKATLTNTLDAPMEAHIAFTVAEESGWEVNPVEVRLRARPGETADQTFDLFYDFAEVTPLPTYRYTVTYAGTTIFERSGTVTPKLTGISEWTLTGGYDLGVDEAPADDAAAMALPAFAEPLAPETDADGVEGVEWVEATGDKNSWIDLTKQFEGDYQIAYGRAFVYSPTARDVVAAVRCDDMVKVLVGDVEVVPHVGAGKDATYVSLPLEAGWNRVLVKSANTTGGWGFSLRISDVDGKLKFSAQPQE